MLLFYRENKIDINFKSCLYKMCCYNKVIRVKMKIDINEIY